MGKAIQDKNKFHFLGQKLNNRIELNQIIDDLRENFGAYSDYVPTITVGTINNVFILIAKNEKELNESHESLIAYDMLKKYYKENKKIMDKHITENIKIYKWDDYFLEFCAFLYSIGYNNSKLERIAIEKCKTNPTKYRLKEINGKMAIVRNNIKYSGNLDTDNINQLNEYRNYRLYYFMEYLREKR